MAGFEINFARMFIRKKKILVQYLSNLNLFWHHHVGNPLMYAANYFRNIHILSWIVIVFLFWTVIHSLHSKLITAILKKMGLSKQDTSNIVVATWNLGFHFGSLPLIVVKIMSVHGIFSSHTKLQHLGSDEFLQTVLFYRQEFIPSHVTVTFIVLCGYHVHKVFLMHKRAPFGAVFFSDIFFLVVFVSTYFLRRVHIGLMVMLAVSVPAILANITRILLTLGKKYSIPVVTFVQNVIFSLHCFSWAGMFLVIFPKYLLWITCINRVANQDVPVLMILNISLWIFFFFQLLFSPTSKVLKYILQPPNGDIFPQNWMEHALFPPPSDLAQQLQQIRRAARNNSRL